ncbi:MAG TPA: class I SAM-dependent methyltransferase [Streptosporangiaceae bacterium]
MDDDLIAVRRSRMRWNTPLSGTHADLLLDRLDLARAGGIADLGCGWGELLMCAVERADGARGVGVDLDPGALTRGRELARRRGLGDRVTFVRAEAASWTKPTDRVLCVGSAHAFGGTRAALAALAAVVPHGGRLLYGDGCWPCPPTEPALDIFGDEVLPMPGVVDAARSAGWRVLHLSTADQREWDDFESTSRAGWQEWLLANDADPRAGEVRTWLDDREHQYIHGYRGALGFAYLILIR